MFFEKFFGNRGPAGTWYRGVEAVACGRSMCLEVKGYVRKRWATKQAQTNSQKQRTKGWLPYEGWRTGEKEKGNTVSKIVVSLHSGVVTW